MILIVAATGKEMDWLLRGAISLRDLEGIIVGERFTWNMFGFLICGVGPLNAAISLEACLAANPQIKQVINFGIAGSYDIKTLPLGSVCVVREEVWPEYGVRSGFFADASILGFPIYQEGERVVWNRLSLVERGFTYGGLKLDPSWMEVVSVTVAGVSSTPEHAKVLRSDFHGQIENMEGFALAYSCFRHDIPFLEIRTISNLAGSRDKKDWNFKSAFSALNRTWHYMTRALQTS
ncbi:futalosine hydrolase [Desulfonatronovibrio magnus]|uniref:futalosine hydrolase n=1 Tax=Desulfonatronovibrio magnus TaxID=698827 RepID=UPI00069666E3|nr:futalosine hydrolase [Desulfonatronovibrio magnus]